MPEDSESLQSDLSVGRHRDEIFLSSYISSIQGAKIEELKRRLILEQERLDRQEVREQRAEGLVLGTLGGLTGTASIMGLIASVAAIPALTPTILVAAAYLWSRLRQQHPEKPRSPAPPVFSSLEIDLARDRELIRCFSPRAPLINRSVAERGLHGD